MAATCRSRTADQLVAADVNTQVDVYVRDMDQADRLARPPSSSSRRATAATCPPRTASRRQLPVPRSPRSPRSAPTAARSCSRTSGGIGPAGQRRSSPPRRGQLFVRDLDANTTTLVTRNKTDGTPAAGANGTSCACRDQRRRLDGRLDRAERRPSDARSSPARPATATTTCGGAWRTGRAPQRGASPAPRTSTIPAAPSPKWIQRRADRHGALLRAAGRPGGLPSPGPPGAAPTLSARRHEGGVPRDPPYAPFPTARQPARPVRDRHDRRPDPQGVDHRADARDPVGRHERTSRPVEDLGRRQPQVAFVSNRRDFGLTIASPDRRRHPRNVNKAELYVVHLDRMEIERVTQRVRRRRDRRDRERRVRGGRDLGRWRAALAFVSLGDEPVPGRRELRRRCVRRLEAQRSDAGGVGASRSRPSPTSPRARMPTRARRSRAAGEPAATAPAAPCG